MSTQQKPLSLSTAELGKLDRVALVSLSEAQACIPTWRDDMDRFEGLADEFDDVGADTERLREAVDRTSAVLDEVEHGLRMEIDRHLDRAADGRTSELDAAMERLKTARDAIATELHLLAESVSPEPGAN
jgi:hypothetical protein